MEQTNETDKLLDSWDDFVSGNFLKAIDVNSPEDAFVVVSVDIAEKDEKKNIRLEFQRNGKDYDFDVNKTNAKKLKELGVVNPKALISKKVFFRKALVRNPKTNQEVEGLRIYKVE